MTPVVEARGQAVISQQADRWRLGVQVHVRSAPRRTQAVATIQRTLEALAGVELTAERVEDGAAFDPEGVIAGWSGVITGSVDGTGQLRELVSRLAGVADVEMHGPRWELSTTAEQEGRAKALASASGVARADADVIARALGGSCGKLIRATSDQSVNNFGTERAVMAMGVSRTMGEALPPRVMELRLVPDLIDVHAQVAVSFLFVPDP